MPTSNKTRARWPMVLIVLVSLAAGGCTTSTTTSGLSLVDEQGNHPTGWVSAHPGFALPDGSLCVPCHGSVTSAAESGGISGVSCFLASRGGQGCHAGGPTFTGVHAVPYRTSEHFQATDNSFASVCSNCHGIDPPSPLSTAPPCRTCHTAGSPLTFLNCSSCHSEPPGGIAYPNIAGAHPTHDNVAGVTGVCDSCHSGLGTGTLAHYNRANARAGKNALRVPPGDLSILAIFDAKSGTASFDNAALTCSKVSCHGGQTTPNWQTGAINPDADCLLCHASGAGEFNGYVSGRHLSHVLAYFPVFAPTFVPPCLGCHDPVKLADPAVGAHYENLLTTAIDTPASVTVGGGSTLVQSYVAGAVGTGTCTPSPTAPCHAARGW